MFLYTKILTLDLKDTGMLSIYKPFKANITTLSTLGDTNCPPPPISLCKPLKLLQDVDGDIVTSILTDSRNNIQKWLLINFRQY